MIYIVTDLEATCDEPQFPSEECEIIEIGSVAVDENFNEIGRFQTFVKPVIHSTLTAFCTGLTHITQADIENAPVFKEAYRAFENWIKGLESQEGNVDAVFASWGGYDFRKLRDSCSRDSINFYFDEGTNLKKLFRKREKMSREVGLRKALTMKGIEFEGTAHRGIDDAANITKLLNYCL